MPQKRYTVDDIAEVLPDATGPAADTPPLPFNSSYLYDTPQLDLTPRPTAPAHMGEGARLLPGAGTRSFELPGGISLPDYATSDDPQIAAAADWLQTHTGSPLLGDAARSGMRAASMLAHLPEQLAVGVPQAVGRQAWNLDKGIARIPFVRHAITGGDPQNEQILNGVMGNGPVDDPAVRMALQMPAGAQPPALGVMDPLLRSRSLAASASGLAADAAMAELTTRAIPGAVREVGGGRLLDALASGVNRVEKVPYIGRPLGAVAEAAGLAPSNLALGQLQSDDPGSGLVMGSLIGSGSRFAKSGNALRESLAAKLEASAEHNVGEAITPGGGKQAYKIHVENQSLPILQETPWFTGQAGLAKQLETKMHEAGAATSAAYDAVRQPDLTAHITTATDAMTDAAQHLLAAEHAGLITLRPHDLTDLIDTVTRLKALNPKSTSAATIDAAHQTLTDIANNLTVVGPSGQPVPGGLLSQLKAIWSRPFTPAGGPVKAARGALGDATSVLGDISGELSTARISTKPILARLNAMIREGSGVATDAGTLATNPDTEGAIKHYVNMRDQVAKFGDDMSLDQARALREKWDDIARGHSGDAMVGKTSEHLPYAVKTTPDVSRISAYQTGRGILRGAINDSAGNAATGNAISEQGMRYSNYRNTVTAMQSTMARKTGHTAGLFTNLATIGGGLMGGGVHEAASAIGHGLEDFTPEGVMGRLAAAVGGGTLAHLVTRYMQSPNFALLSGKSKLAIAEALRGGNSGALYSAMRTALFEGMMGGTMGADNTLTEGLQSATGGAPMGGPTPDDLAAFQARIKADSEQATQSHGPVAISPDGPHTQPVTSSPSMETMPMPGMDDPRMRDSGGGEGESGINEQGIGSLPPQVGDFLKKGLGLLNYQMVDDPTPTGNRFIDNMKTAAARSATPMNALFAAESAARPFALGTRFEPVVEGVGRGLGATMGAQGAYDTYTGLRDQKPGSVISGLTQLALGGLSLRKGGVASAAAEGAAQLPGMAERTGAALRGVGLNVAAGPAIALSAHTLADTPLMKELIPDDDTREAVTNTIAVAASAFTMAHLGTVLARGSKAEKVKAIQAAIDEADAKLGGGDDSGGGGGGPAGRLRQGLRQAQDYGDTKFILPDGTRLAHTSDSHWDAAQGVGVDLHDAMRHGVVRYAPGGGAETMSPITREQAQHIVDASVQSGGNNPIYVDIPGGRADGGTDSMTFTGARANVNAVRNWVNGHFAWSETGIQGGGGPDEPVHPEATQSDARAGGGGRNAVSTAARRPDANPDAQAVADRYTAARGLPPVQHGYVSVDEQRAHAIANAYDALPVDDRGNPKVRKAYAALTREINDQFDHITASGMHFEPWTQEGQPYQTSAEMAADIRDNHHMYFFTGGEPHPLLDARDPKTGLTTNEKFRAVHDYFGHAAGGYGFGPRGEENAWVAHSQMFSPEARQAMTTETRGQNSWTNFGRHNYDAEGNHTNVPPADRPFAQQKVALLPDEHVQLPDEVRGRAGAEPVSTSDARAPKTPPPPPPLRTRADAAPAIKPKDVRFGVHPTSTAKAILAHILDPNGYGGITVDLKNGAQPEAGSMTSVFSNDEVNATPPTDRVMKVPRSKLTEAVLNTFLEKNRDQLAKRERYLGAWTVETNKATGKPYVDAQGNPDPMVFLDTPTRFKSDTSAELQAQKAGVPIGKVAPGARKAALDKQIRRATIRAEAGQGYDRLSDVAPGGWDKSLYPPGEAPVTRDPLPQEKIWTQDVDPKTGAPVGETDVGSFYDHLHRELTPTAASAFWKGMVEGTPQEMVPAGGFKEPPPHGYDQGGNTYGISLYDLRMHYLKQLGSEHYRQNPDSHGGGDWMNIRGGPVEKLIDPDGTHPERVVQMAGYLAATSNQSTPEQNFREATEYMRRSVAGEPIIQPEFRGPATAISPRYRGKQMSGEATRAEALLQSSRGETITTPKKGPMNRALLGDKTQSTIDTHQAKVAEDPPTGVYATEEQGVVDDPRVSGIIQRRIATLAERNGTTAEDFASTAWVGIRELLKKTGVAFGVKYGKRSAGESRGFNDMVDPMVTEAAKHYNITPAEFIDRFARKGNLSLLTALMATAPGAALFNRWLASQQGDSRDDASSVPSMPAYARGGVSAHQ